MAPSNETVPNGSCNGETKPANWTPVAEAPLHARRHMKMICIGAGFSGLTLAHKIKYEHGLENDIDLTIYEKNPEVGGTWYENRYPGVACDIPAHVYTFPFEPNPDWSAFYAPGPEIQAYIKRATKKWKLDEKVQLNSRVTSAIWDEAAGRWNLKIQHGSEEKEDHCDVLVNGGGFLNKWKWPEIKGLQDYKGKLLHTACWDDSFDWEGKKVAVIGNGSSGIQVVTGMASKTARIVNYVRNPTWVSVNFLPEHAREGKNFSYTDEERKRFKEDPQELYKYRKTLERSLNAFFFALVDGHPASQGLMAICDSQMRERCKFDPSLAEKLIPPFRPGCRRLTPGDGYLEAFEDGKNEMCWDPIECLTEKGIKTAKGEEHFDAIVCATGFDTTFIPPFKLVGRNGATLEKRWAQDPDAFFSVQVDTMPNYFIYNGPMAAIQHGSVLTNMGFISDYILRWTTKLATEDIKSMDVKKESVDDYNVYAQELVKRTAFSDPCRSWYKNGKTEGAVTGAYAASYLHLRECLYTLGAEHFNFTYNSANRFRFLGNGETLGDLGGAGEMAGYMDEAEANRVRLEKLLLEKTQ